MTEGEEKAQDAMLTLAGKVKKFLMTKTEYTKYAITI
jgi:hypothetical protein